MRVNIVSIGNSKGVRIPKAILEQCSFNKEAEIEVQNNRLIIKPVRKIREGWANAFKLMHDKKEDALLINDTVDLEMSNWEW